MSHCAINITILSFEAAKSALSVKHRLSGPAEESILNLAEEMSQSLISLPEDEPLGRLVRCVVALLHLRINVRTAIQRELTNEDAAVCVGPPSTHHLYTAAISSL